MNEATVTLIIAVVTTLGSVVTGLFGWLAKKGVSYIDRQTKVLDDVSDLERKESVKRKIVDTVTLVARATMQTYVDEVKARNTDGKLTKAEAAESFQRTLDQSLDLLRREGIEVSREILAIVVEAVVGQLKIEKNGTNGKAAA